MKSLVQSQTFRQVALFSGMLGLTLLLAVLVSEPSFANGFIDASDNPSLISNATGGEGDARTLLLRIVNFFLGFLGVVAVLMVVYGGVLYVTSAGNDDNVGKAKKIILYAIIGILIILSAFALINTVFGAASQGAIGV